jgi:hypothetical protein
MFVPLKKLSLYQFVSKICSTYMVAKLLFLRSLNSQSPSNIYIFKNNKKKLLIYIFLQKHKKQITNTFFCFSFSLHFKLKHKCGKCRRYLFQLKNSPQKWGCSHAYHVGYGQGETEEIFSSKDLCFGCNTPDVCNYRVCEMCQVSFNLQFFVLFFQKSFLCMFFFV